MSAHVFVSYVRENTPEIQRLVADLEARGLSVWMDRTRLAAGERWRDAIRRAIRGGDLFLACFSRAYARRGRSHMNEELTLAIEELRLRPANRAWFIPVVLNGGEVPDRAVSSGETLRDFQWVNLDENWELGVDMIIEAAVRAVERGSSESDVTITSDEAWPRDNSPRANSQPVLTIDVGLQRGASYWRKVTHQEVRVILSLSNGGPGVLTAPHIRFRAPDAFNIRPLGVASLESGASLQMVMETGQPPAASLIGRFDFVIYVGMTVQIAELTTTIKGSMRLRHCDIEFRIASSDSATRETVLRIPAEDIARLLERTIEPIESE